MTQFSTVEELKPKVAAQAKAGQANEYITACTEEALALVTKYIGPAQGVPKSIADRAVIETAAELFWRRNAQNGIAQFGDGESLSLMRIGSDPLRPARNLLREWLGVPIA